MFVAEFIPSGMMRVVAVSNGIEVASLPWTRGITWPFRQAVPHCATEPQHFYVLEHVVSADRLPSRRVHLVHIRTCNHDRAVVHTELSIHDGNCTSAQQATDLVRVRR